MLPPEKPAGRKPLDHEVPPWIDADASEYFITICCHPHGVNQLCKPEVADVLLASARFYSAQQKWFLAPFVLMPDHVRMLACFPRAYRMETVVSAWKRYTAAKAGIRWQDRFFEHRLRSHESAEEKARYILNNPVRAGLVAEAAAWPYLRCTDPAQEAWMKQRT